MVKILVISDLHLGNDASKAPALLDGVARIARNYDRIIFNGDTLDVYARPEHVAAGTKAARFLEAVHATCRSRSGPPELITGNHDPLISDTHYIYIKEHRALIFHGDCIADSTHPSDPHENILANHVGNHWKKIGGRPSQFVELATTYRRLQGEHLGQFPRKEHRSSLSYLLSLCYPPQKPFHVLKYVLTSPYLAAELAGTHDAPVDHVVIGHTHRAGNWKTKDRSVLNTGSFMPMSWPSAVVMDEQGVQRIPLAKLLRTHITTVHMAVGEPAN